MTLQAGDGPLCVFADQRLGVVFRRTAQGGQGAGIAEISQSDADVAEQAPALGAFDGAVLEPGPEAVIV